MLYSDNKRVYFSYVIVVGKVYGLAINVMKPFARSALNMYVACIGKVLNYRLSTA